MTKKDKPTPNKKYPESTEYKGRKVKFFDLSSSELPNSELHGKEAFEVEKRSDLQDKKALEVEKRSDKSQKHLRKLKVEIDEKEFEVVELQEGLFESGLLPYSSYESPVDLAQDVIDYVSEFRK
ncbi:hypothetical protein [uncultured Psychrobacter sp.]|uniref:hypothetical protein n=1 Tax=uncultured Psychrobacter sp. TaxID=259303 RepID=UPI002604B213|nr:hypothetical protein [uncultured Psychrobacter sp.]